MIRLRTLLGNRLQYFIEWCNDYLVDPDSVALVITQMKGQGDWINDYRISLGLMRDADGDKLEYRHSFFDIPRTVRKKILQYMGIRYDISDICLLLSKYMFRDYGVTRYQYEMQYSSQYKCPKCGHPCDYQELQIRRGDEASNTIITCTNCNFQQRK